MYLSVGLKPKVWHSVRSHAFKRLVFPKCHRHWFLLLSLVTWLSLSHFQDQNIKMKGQNKYLFSPYRGFHFQIISSRRNSLRFSLTKWYSMVPGVEILLIVIWAQQFLINWKHVAFKQESGLWSYWNNSQFSEVLRTDSFHKLTTQLIQPTSCG